MSFNGSGTFVINSAGQPVVSGTVISSTAFNALTADLANGLSTCITKDGQTTPTADIPMGSNKITGLANGTAAGDAANLGQVQSTVAKLLGSVSGADTITAVGSPTVAAYAAGQMFYFVAAGANTGAVTINIDSLGAKSITRDGTTALAAGDIQSGEVCVIVYDGTQFQLVNGASQSAAIVTNSLTVNGTSSLDGAVTINDSGADVDFRVEGDTDANLLFVDASTDRIGIGTSSPGAKLECLAGTANSEYMRVGGPSSPSGRALRFSSLNSGADDSGHTINSPSSLGFIGFQTNSIERFNIKTTEAVFNDLGNDYDFRVESDTNTHALFVDAGVSKVGIGTSSFNTNGGVLQVSNGISFPATQSACSDANTLDDYEEGTFTATLNSAGNTGATTLTSVIGRYTKIGDTVTVWCQFALDANLNAVNDYCSVAGLPFTAAAYGSSRSAAVGSFRTADFQLENRMSSGVCTVFEGTTIVDILTTFAGSGAAYDTNIGTFAVTYAV